MMQAKRAVKIFLLFSVLCGIVYPLAVTVVAQVLFPHRANGSLVTMDGRIVGSELIGQMFENPKYFHGRPSAADPAYNASGSTGSNFGPSSAKLLKEVKGRIENIRRENGLAFQTPIPADLVLTSASGLDPHISPESAMLQVHRVAGERRMPDSEIKRLVVRHIEKPLLGLWGQETVNVLKLNIALDAIKR